MSIPLERLAKNTKNIEQFVNAVIKFPRFYLRTDEEKRMSKKDLRDFYQERSGL